MSTLRTNAILDASGGTTATVNGYAPSLSNMAGRNRIINGDMRIDQRNAGAEVSPAPSGYTVDRFATFKSGAGTFKFQQSTDAPTYFQNSLLLTVTSASSPSGGDYYLIQHPVEGYNIADLSWGTASPQTVTLSFWVKSSVTGLFSGSIRNGSTSHSYVFTYSISAANTWENKKIVVEGPTVGTWPATNSIGLSVVMSLGQGSTYATGTIGSWVSGNFHGATTEVDWIATSGATFYLTGVQLEAGSIATPFERRLYGDELARCQRYHTRLGGVGYAGIASGVQRNTTGASFALTFPTAMRASPSTTFSNLMVTDRTRYEEPITSMSATASPNGAYLDTSFSTAVGAAFNGTLLAVRSGTSGTLVFDAEL